MNDNSPENREPGPSGRPPLQFSLKALLALPVLVGLVFGTLRWLGVSPLACGIILATVTLSAVAAIGLLAVLASSDDR
jgi:Flp pilus assembly protein TadB